MEILLRFPRQFPFGQNVNKRNILRALQRRNSPFGWAFSVSIAKRQKIMKNQYTAIGRTLLPLYNQLNR